MPTKKRERSVELLQAFMWTCPECGRDSFERTIVVELSPEEMQEVRILHGVEVWEQGVFLTAPSTVECKHCKIEFAAHHMDEHVDDEGI